MLAARRRIIDQPMVPSVIEPGKLVPDALVVRSPDLQPLLSEPVGGRITNVLAENAGRAVTGGDAEGVFTAAWPWAADYLGVATYPAGNRGVRRHEVMHGYNEAARLGDERMPFWSRVAGAATPAISLPLDELIAQRVGGTAFMDIPWGDYARRYAQLGEAGAARSARALEAAQQAMQLGVRAAEFAADHPVLLGAGVGTAYLLNHALAEEEEAQAGH